FPYTTLFRSKSRGSTSAGGYSWRQGIYDEIRTRMPLQGGLGVEQMCHLAQASRAGFYRYLRSGWQGEEELALRSAVQSLVIEHRWRYGYRRVTAELRMQGMVANHKRIARIMRDDNLLALRHECFRPDDRSLRAARRERSSGRKHSCRRASRLSSRMIRAIRLWFARIMRDDNLLALRHECFRPDDRSLRAARIYLNLANRMTLSGPNQLWAGDITYIRLSCEFVYLAVVLDIFSRKVIGWALGRTLKSQLPLSALERAIANRRPPPGVVHHSDQGVQYTSREYMQKLREHQILPSMSRPANPYDNATCESFIKTLK